MNPQVHIVGPQFSSFVRSVMLCCEEKGVSYTWGFQLGASTLRFGSERHLELHPYGLVPILIHNNRSLFETSSICRYIDHAFEGPALQPVDPYEKALVDQWSQAISVYTDEALVRNYLLPLIQPMGDDETAQREALAKAEKEARKHLTLLETQLGNQAFICGDAYSIADALLIPMLDYLANSPEGGKLLEQFPSLAAYAEQMRNRASGETVLTTRKLT